jgi:serine phosphatase RsbU (regulator of sigma subunit)/tetratricopeptide (TPR) repeat protein
MRAFRLFLLLCLLLSLSFGALAQTQAGIDSIAVWKELLVEAQTRDDSRLAGDLLMRLGEQYVNMRQTDLAKQHFLKAQRQYEKGWNAAGEAKAWFRVGNILEEEDGMLALEAYNRSSELYRNQLKDKRGYSEAFIRIGRLYLRQAKPKAALDAFNRVRNIAEQEEYNDLLLETYTNLSNAYEELGRESEALSYLRLYKTEAQKQRESIMQRSEAAIKETQALSSQQLQESNRLIRIRDQQLREIAEAKTQLDELNKMRDIEIENLKNAQRLKEQEIAEKERQIQMQKLIRNVSLGTVLLFLLFVVQLVRANQQRKESNRKLSKQNSEISRQKQEIERQSVQMLVNNLQMRINQEEVLEQKEEISNMMTSVEQFNQQISLQRDELENQKGELEKSNATIKQLSLIGQALTATLSQQQLLGALFKELSTQLKVSIIGVGLYNSKNKEILFEGIEESGDTYESINTSSIALAEYDHPAVEAFNSQWPLLVSNTRNSRFSPDIPFYPGSSETTRSLMYLPLKFADKMVGLLTVQSFRSDTYTNADLSFMQSVASYVAISLQNIAAVSKLEEANSIIEGKNRSILDSIRYAEHIQQAVLPEHDDLLPYLPNFFIYYRPRDIVSGDFYWFAGKGDKAILAVADCTGHGVPGAFMSMIGSILLDDIINRQDITDPATILEKLHLGVRTALKQDHTSNTDGMDTCLCVFEKKKDGKQRLHYAGAKRPLYVVSPDGEFSQVDSDRKSVGGRQKEAYRSFSKQCLEYSEGTMLYLTSDGYADQHNSQNIKYGNRKFKQYLTQLAGAEIAEQHRQIDKELQTYRADRIQRDDITVVGIRI